MGSKTPPSDGLAAWIAGQRWFASKRRRIVDVRVDDRVPVGDAGLAVVRVTLDDGGAERYLLALGRGPGVHDALDDPAFCRALLGVLAAGGRTRGERGTVVGRPTRAFPGNLPPDVPARRLTGEQSNTSIAFGTALVMKVFRRVTEGINPEEEITRFLTERTAFRGSPRLAGALAYDAGGGTPATVAVVQEYIADGVDGWRWMLDRLAAGDPALEALRRLGATTAGLHRALATPTGDPAFDPEPVTQSDVEAWAEAVARQVALAREAAPAHALPGAGDHLAGPGGLGGLVGTDKIRHHGDFHLGQTLRADARDAFAIIDFEGEPLRPLAERRRKHSPLRDVAGMLRSLAYAAETARAADRRRDARLEDWERAARSAFLEGYVGAARAAAFLPGEEEAFRRAVAVFELEKAAYEVVYEADHRPDWIGIPLRGVTAAARTLGAT